MPSRVPLATVIVWALAGTTAHCQQRGAEAEAKAGPNIVLQNDDLRYVIGADGRNLSFMDRRTGTEYCAQAGGRPVMKLRKGTV